MSHSGRADNIISSLIPTKNPINVLDIGSGYGQIGLLIKSLNPQAHLSGIEIHEPYYRQQLKMRLYDKMYFGDAVDIVPTLFDKKYHVVIGSHFIEHLEDIEGVWLMRLIEKDLKPNLIIWTTPNEGSPAHIKDGNKYNLHKSSWSVQDFKKLGYEVELATVLINSKAVNTFAYLWFKLRGRQWNKSIIVAYKKRKY